MNLLTQQAESLVKMLMQVCVQTKDENERNKTMGTFNKAKEGGKEKERKMKTHRVSRKRNKVKKTS